MSDPVIVITGDDGYPEVVPAPGWNFPAPDVAPVGDGGEEATEGESEQ